MNKNRNIFIEHKKTVLQVTRANDAPTISVGANMAVAMAKDVLAGRPVQGSTQGVQDWVTWVGEVENLTDSQIGHQMAEFNQAATEAIQRGKPWTL